MKEPHEAENTHSIAVLIGIVKQAEFSGRLGNLEGIIPL
jgi:3-dehydroquinate synthetase